MARNLVDCVDDAANQNSFTLFVSTSGLIRAGISQHHSRERPAAQILSAVALFVAAHAACITFCFSAAREPHAFRILHSPSFARG